MKDYWIGALVLIFVLLFTGALMSINHNKYEELTDNLSDNKSDNLPNNSVDNCWTEKTSKLSNTTYKEKVKCSPNQTSSAE
ncbi:MAG: hypothetical protein ACNS64_01265 [Candidatus Halalkalibacterium sp. M3_1C_030]